MSSLLLLALLTVGGDSQPVDFDTDVLPILTRAGCNTAACHGAAAGRGGMRLSLFGGDPQADHRALVREREGRRVNLAHPEDSLLLAKPTGMLDHEGGLRLEYDGSDAQLLARWIDEGAVRHRSRQLRQLELQPETFLAEKIPSRLSVRLHAQFDDGSRRDVTARAMLTSSDEAAVRVLDNGELEILRRGQHRVVVRYLSEVRTIQLIVPLGDDPVQLADHPRFNWIDEYVYDKLSQLRLTPAPTAGDAELLRRVYLDLCGRLPGAERTRRFLDDPAADKYERLVEQLLQSPAFHEYWTFRLAELLRIRSQPKESDGARAFHTWVAEQLRNDRNWADVVRQMLTAEGDSFSVGPANFYRIATGPREQAEYVSEVLLGVRLRCANCHNHPLDRWTQDDYHGLAAVFARVQQNRVVKLLPRGEVIHPRTGQAAVARIPGQRFLNSEGDDRKQLADWITDRDNPYFARAMVNRLWKALLGRGLVEPADDLRATNPATHPELLDRLAADFAEHDFRLQHTLQRIVLSAAYRRGRHDSRASFADDRFYAEALPRPLPAQVLADALADVTGVPDRYPDQATGTRAVQLFDPRIDAPSLDILGRCDRDGSCESSGAPVGGLSKRLHLLNGPLINAKIADPQGHVQEQLRARADPTKLVERFYLDALARLPTPAEAAYWREQLQPDGQFDSERFEDFVWSLLSCREFTTNH